MMRAASLALGASLFLLPALHAQPEAGELDQLLDRLGRYLLAYEEQLTTVIADEHYEQHEIQLQRPRGRNGGPADAIYNVRTRKLDSEIAFLRLPDGSLWFGLRDVKRVDGKPASSNTRQLEQLLRRFDDAALKEAVSIIARSAEHNLGGIRTINMPTTPLEVLHPDHHVQFVFKLRGTEKINGTRTVKLEFEEFDVPTIISGTDGSPSFIRGTAWIQPDDGRLWRVEMLVTPKINDRLLTQFASRMRVDYTPHRELKMMVPKELIETFFIPGGRGEGRAKYSNFRQFGTSARVVPQ